MLPPTSQCVALSGMGGGKKPFACSHAIDPRYASGGPSILCLSTPLVILVDEVAHLATGKLTYSTVWPSN